MVAKRHKKHTNKILNEPQKERRTPQKTKDDLLVAFPWRGCAMELIAVFTVGGKTTKLTHSF
jgi:hypothetical protein